MCSKCVQSSKEQTRKTGKYQRLLEVQDYSKMGKMKKQNFRLECNFVYTIIKRMEKRNKNNHLLFIIAEEQGVFNETVR